MTTPNVGRAVPDGLSQAEPVARLGPTGFDPSRIAAVLDASDLCERADGPDRLIDAAIAKAGGLPHGRDSGWCNSENGDYWVVDECAKRFTASVDAAMTLIPADWEWGMENCGGETYGPYRVEMGCRIDIEARTLPLAICCAALRAQAAIAMEARQGRDGETRLDAKHDSAGPQGHRPKEVGQ